MYHMITPSRSNCCSGSLLLQKVVPDHFFANVVQDHLCCKFLFQITSLQIVVLDHFFANVVPDHLFCKFLFQITSLQIVVLDHFFANCCSGSLLLQIIVPDHFFANCFSGSLLLQFFFRITCLQIRGK